MHDYAVFGHDRSAIGRWLGMLAVLGAGAISQVVVVLAGLTGWEAFTKATVTTGVLYFVLHWLFNRWGWKNRFVAIPDLNSEWEINARTLDEDGTTKYDWVGVLAIE